MWAFLVDGTLFRTRYDITTGGDSLSVTPLHDHGQRDPRVLREGVVADQTELAGLAKVTQPRMTQIMNLLHLAPEIQDVLLHLPRVTSGKDPVTERDLRPIVAELDWDGQRRMWGTVAAMTADATD